LTAEKAFLGTDHRHTLDTTHWMGIVHYNLRHYATALERFQNALPARKLLRTADHKNTTIILYNMSLVHYCLRHHDEVFYWFRKVLFRSKALCGADHESVLETKHWIEKITQTSEAGQMNE
jgi:Tetratricopeptide repeat